MELSKRTTLLAGSSSAKTQQVRQLDLASVVRLAWKLVKAIHYQVHTSEMMVSNERVIDANKVIWKSDNFT